ncbi:MAG: hypothetical protein PVS3B3_36200 [Ktedonobacteraceae bacterium]
MSDTIRPYGDNFIPVIPTDAKEHTDEHPFCVANPNCPCHEDLELIAPVHKAVNDGLMTPDEATDYVMGRTLQGGWS